MLSEDEDDSEGLGNIGFMSEKLKSEALFWRIVCGMHLSLQEVDSWTLDEMRCASSWMEMQNDHKRIWTPYYDMKKEKGEFGDNA